MQKAEVYEEIRALLREPQVNTVTKPWNYRDEDIVPQIRSALRYLRTGSGLAAVVGAMDATGTFAPEPTDMEGMLIALFVAHRLIGGDLTQKLAAGELGVLFKTGGDTIDTKQASSEFQKVASAYADRFNVMLAIALANQDGGSNSVIGDSTGFWA